MNEIAAPHPLEAFRKALSARREEVVDKLLAAFVARRPSADSAYSADALAEIRIHREREFDLHLEALLDPEASGLMASLVMRVQSALARGLEPSMVQKLNMDMRRILLDAGLALHAAGVPGATAGIRRLVEISGEPVRLFDAAFRARAAQTRRTAQIFEAVIDRAPDAIGVAEPGGRIIQANPAMLALLRMDVLVGRSLNELVAPQSREFLRTEAASVMQERGAWTGTLFYSRGDGTELEALVTAFIVRDESGKDLSRCAILRDLSVARAAEAERQKLVAEVIAAQKQALEEIGTPLVPVAEGVLVMPLVGRLDAARAGRMLGVLLEGIERQHARVVLVDVTGAKAADAESASGLMTAAAAAKLLGAELMVTGISPELARTLVELDSGFGAITTKATLGDGVKHALKMVRGDRG